MLRRRWIAWGRKGRQTDMCLTWNRSTCSQERGKLVKRTGDSVLRRWNTLTRLFPGLVSQSWESWSVNWTEQWSNSRTWCFAESYGYALNVRVWVIFVTVLYYRYFGWAVVSHFWSFGCFRLAGQERFIDVTVLLLMDKSYSCARENIGSVHMKSPFFANALLLEGVDRSLNWWKVTDISMPAVKELS